MTDYERLTSVAAPCTMYKVEHLQGLYECVHESGLMACKLAECVNSMPISAMAQNSSFYRIFGQPLGAVAPTFVSSSTSARQHNGRFKHWDTSQTPKLASYALHKFDFHGRLWIVLFHESRAQLVKFSGVLIANYKRLRRQSVLPCVQASSGPAPPGS